MRRRAITSMSRNEHKQEEPNFLRQQYQSIYRLNRIETRIQLSILEQKYDLLEKQRDILKKGNSHLVSQFLFNKDREQLSKLNRQVKQKREQNTELKRIIGQLESMVKNAMQIGRQGVRGSRGGFQSVRRFSVRLENDKMITTNKQSSIGHELKVQLKELIDDYKKLVKSGGRLYKSININNNNSNINNQSQNDNNNTEIQNSFIQSQVVMVKSRQVQHSLSIKQQQQQEQQRDLQQLSRKVNNLTIQNGELREKLQKLTLDLGNNTKNNINDTDNKRKIHTDNNNNNLSSQMQAKDKNPNIFNLNDYSIPIMSTSQYNNQQLQNSIIYNKFSESSILHESVLTESYDKRINKLQKNNSMLEKDYHLAKEKIKTLNRQYSKLKLDYLKFQQEKKKLEETYQRKIQTLNQKIQTLNKKIKDLQVLNDKSKSQKNKQKQSHKAIISQYQSKIVQLQQKIQKNVIQISSFKEKLQLSKKEKQKQNTTIKQLQLEREKYKQLQKQLEQRASNFQQSIKKYQKIIEEMRKVNGKSKDKEVTMIERQNKSRSRSRQSSIRQKSNSFQLLSPSLMTPSQASLLGALRQEIKLLQQTIKIENERYNILQNSNKQLRQRLIRMIQNEEKLRKQLINERIKSRTNKSVSQSSKYSNRARSIIKKSVDYGDHMDSSHQYHDDNGGEQYEPKSETRLDELKIKITQNENMPYFVISTDRNSQSCINNTLQDKALKQSNSSRSFKSQSMISNNQKQVYDNKRTNINNNNTATSQLKMLRQRRFDPKQTIVNKKITTSYNTTGQIDNIDKPQSPVDCFNYLIDQNKQILPTKKYQKKHQLQEQTYYQPTYGKSAINKSKPKQIQQQKKQKHQSPTVTRSPKYVYQPPKPKGFSQKQFSPSSSQLQQPLIPTSQPPTDNKEFSLQISQSQSNLSKGDKIIELLSINNDTNKFQDSPFVNPFLQNTYGTKPSAVKQQPVIVGKFSDLEVEKKQGTNIVMNGRTQQQTKSSAQVRFTRKF